MCATDEESVRVEINYVTVDLGLRYSNFGTQWNHLKKTTSLRDTLPKYESLLQFIACIQVFPSEQINCNNGHLRHISLELHIDERVERKRGKTADSH